jgi:tryptophanyl-tRNA synthetase
MSKSYDNTIPLFEGGPKRLREAIFRIVTDSREPGEPKDPDSSALFTLYRAFASPAESAAMRSALEQGLAWGEAKQRLYERLESELAPMRERYDALMARPDEIEQVLQAGARNARAVAGPFLAALRAAVGLRRFGRSADVAAVGARLARDSEAHAMRDPAAEAAPPSFKQYRGDDQRFYFKLVDAEGRLLLQSTGFDSPRAAGQLIARLKAQGGVLRVVDGTACVDGEAIGTLGEGVGATDATAALARLAGQD